MTDSLEVSYTRYCSSTAIELCLWSRQDTLRAWSKIYMRTLGLCMTFWVNLDFELGFMNWFQIEWKLGDHCHCVAGSHTVMVWFDIDIWHMTVLYPLYIHQFKLRILTLRVSEPWNKLLREMEEPSSLEIFKPNFPVQPIVGNLLPEGWNRGSFQYLKRAYKKEGEWLFKRWIVIGQREWFKTETGEVWVGY